MVIYATWESSTDREDFDLFQTERDSSMSNTFRPNFFSIKLSYTNLKHRHQTRQQARLDLCIGLIDDYAKNGVTVAVRILCSFNHNLFGH